MCLCEECTLPSAGGGSNTYLCSRWHTGKWSMPGGREIVTRTGGWPGNIDWCSFRVGRSFTVPRITSCRHFSKVHYIIVNLFLSSFANLRKGTLNFIMSLRLYACLPACLSWNNSAPTRQVFMKFDIWVNQLINQFINQLMHSVIQIVVYVKIYIV
jgi:hypothetical protein